MKTKLVLWGNDAEDKRILIAMELQETENKVNIWTFHEPEANEEFAERLMKEWRDGGEVPFPESHQSLERELTVTDSLLPEEIKVDRPDIVQRAQTEWHFIVLSSKMSRMYESELGELKERIQQLEKFDSDIWEELKTFWDKVQEQVRDKNLFREHADNLRDHTNELFSKMKELRSAMDEEFKKTSKQVHDRFMEGIEEVEEKLEKGTARLQTLFDDLKKMQREFRDAELTRDHRSSLWDRIDAAFKAVKLKKFGNKGAQDSSPLDRIQRRYKGLLNAIEKMERSIKRDRDDLNFQQKKADTTDGQLEAQIRQAKILMIEERIRSKEEKLGEMNQTREELEKRMESLKKKAAEEEKKKEIEAAKAAAKEKIAEEIKEAEKKREEIAEKLEKAVEEVKGETPAEKEPKKEPEESFAESVEDAIEDVVDTVKAVASVVSDKIEAAMDELQEKLEEAEMPEEPAQPEEPAEDKEGTTDSDVDASSKEDTAENKPESASESEEEDKE